VTTEFESGLSDIRGLKGWLPVDAVVVEGRPGLSWMNMEGVCFSEPFFQQTVERVRMERPARGELFTEFDALLQLEKVLDSVQPTGFIFHSSRSGSTLVANACRAVADSIVLSEPYAVDKLIARFITDTSEGTIKEMLYSVFLRAAVNVLAQRRTGNERHLFVKFSCCSVFELDRIRRIWPTVPWIFLYRDPSETIVSNLTTLPEWMLDNDHRVLASIIGTSATSIAEMSGEELCARAIGSFYSTANRLANDKCMLLNYDQLSVAVLLSILHFFKVTTTPEEANAITIASRMYSKDRFPSRQFVPDTNAKVQGAPEVVCRMAERWAAGPYRLLEKTRLEMGGLANSATL
jgi:hypothetical protein